MSVRVECKCENCGAAFWVMPSRLRHGRGKHCSPACQYAAISKRLRPSVFCRCSCCGIEFSIPPSKLKTRGAGKYCSRPCRDRHWRGSSTPNWQGIREPHRHGPTWYGARRRALNRDGHACQCCGATQHLHVHHALPGRLFASSEAANGLDNLVTLCDSCHRREEARSRWITIGPGIGDPEGGAIRFTPGGVAWTLAKQAGLL